MTEKQSQKIRQQIIQLRKQLSALETRRSADPMDSNNDIWDSFLHLNQELSQLEQKLLTINDSITQDIQQCRDQIITNLQEYNRISQGMREMEKFFLMNFLRPGHVLKQATRKREYLEKEYSRIHSGIIDHLFHTLQEVGAEIRKVLMHSDTAYTADQRSYEDEQVKEVNLWEVVESIDPQDIVEDVDEDQITNDFRRIVLPAVHPDTSETPKEVFLTVMGVYKTLDYLLMEAYVVQYREETEPDTESEQDVLLNYDILSQRQREYHRLSERLDRRLNAIKRELDPIEINQPDKVRENILKLREEIKHNIQREGEKIFELRRKIQELTDFFIQVKRMDDDQ